ncbi:MAG TPA: hypothetical protein VI282_07955 [Verrucomicrobiae bacterium]
MKKLVLIAAVLLAAVAASAQVKVEVVFDGEQYIANEPLTARVRIINDSGSTLRLAETADWLDFAVRVKENGKEGPYVRPLRPPTHVDAFPLESSKTATVRMDLSPCFNLTQVGEYQVVATVKVPAFSTTYASAPKTFFIVTGSRMWERPFGVPASIAAPDPSGLPEMRKYMLIQALSGKETKFYVRLTDAQENNIKVIPIGSLISFSRPEPQLDKWSNLHVLYQIGSKAFVYTVINPNGLLIARETHEISDTRPTMTTTDEGRIVIRGGKRRPTIDDIPPYDAAQIPADTAQPIAAPAPSATATNSVKKPASSANAKDKKKR